MATQKYLIDSEGNKVKKSELKTFIVKREDYVDSIFKIIEKLSKQLQDAKEKVDTHTTKYLTTRAKEEKLEDWKGNVELTDYAGNRRIRIQQKDIFEFDIELLQLAKQKVEICIDKWSKGASSKLKTLVKHAFRIDKKGKVNRMALMQLKQYNFEDVEWNEGIELINQSMKVVTSKRYETFYKKNEQGEWEQISLNYSSL